MNSAIGALAGLAIAIILITRRFSPVYSLLLGAVAGGIIGGMGLDSTVANMISGIKDISPAIIRIIDQYQEQAAPHVGEYVRSMKEALKK